MNDRHRLIDDVARQLAHYGFVAADDEAADLVDFSGGDTPVLRQLVERRLTGEPFAWITGCTTFCDQRMNVQSGVYVPRWQTEPLVRRALARLPRDGTAVDVCTGSGAVAMVLGRVRPDARVVATDVDPVAVACARSNGVTAYVGDLFDTLPSEIAGMVDLVVGVVPYVPTWALGLLQRDTFAFETSLPYHGGVDGMDLLRRVAADARAFLRGGAVIILELGADQAGPMGLELVSLGYEAVKVLFDDEGDCNGIEAIYAEATRRSLSVPSR